MMDSWKYNTLEKVKKNLFKIIYLILLVVLLLIIVNQQEKNNSSANSQIHTEQVDKDGDQPNKK